jgi:hypothetical protein
LRVFFLFARNEGITFFPVTQFFAISNNLIFLFTPFIGDKQIQSNPFHIPTILAYDVVEMKRRLDFAVETPGFPVYPSLFWMIPIGDNILEFYVVV